MMKKIVLTAAVLSIMTLSFTTTSLASIIHSNQSSQNLGLADLSGASYNVTVIGGENFWIIGAMIAAAIVFMLIDRAKAKKKGS